MEQFQDAQRATAFEQAWIGIKAAGDAALTALTPLGRLADRTFSAASRMAGRALAGAAVLAAPFAFESLAHA